LDIPHHGLFHLGYLGDILKALQIPGRNTRFIIKGPVEFGPVKNPLEYALELLCLKLLQPLPGQGLKNRVPVGGIMVHGFSPGRSILFEGEEVVAKLIKIGVSLTRVPIRKTFHISPGFCNR
jgi:hypothetical protein